VLTTLFVTTVRPLNDADYKFTGVVTTDAAGKLLRPPGDGGRRSRVPQRIRIESNS
jgi:hypothetical protein